MRGFKRTNIITREGKIMGVIKKRLVLLAMLLTFAVCFGQENLVSAAADIRFDATEVEYVRGKTVISGVFSNYGDVGARVQTARIKVYIFDDDENYLFHDISEFTNVGVYVPAGTQVRHKFNIYNRRAVGYHGRIKWDVNTRLYW